MSKPNTLGSRREGECISKRPCSGLGGLGHGCITYLTDSARNISGSEVGGATVRVYGLCPLGSRGKVAGYSQGDFVPLKPLTFY